MKSYSLISVSKLPQIHNLVVLSLSASKYCIQKIFTDINNKHFYKFLWNNQLKENYEGVYGGVWR